MVATSRATNPLPKAMDTGLARRLPAPGAMSPAAMGLSEVMADLEAAVPMGAMGALGASGVLGASGALGATGALEAG